MKALPAVVRAEYRGEFRIRVVFNDGVDATLDFTDWLDGPIFEPLKDPSFFARFFVEGGTVAWPNGADIAPETLHELRVAGQFRVHDLDRHRTSTWGVAEVDPTHPARTQPCLQAVTANLPRVIRRQRLHECDHTGRCQHPR